MSKVDIETKELYLCGQDIMQLTNELNEQFETLFNRIDGINKNTFEWVGTSSNEFVRRSNIEKKEYYRIKDELYNYGKILTEIANEYENLSSEIGVE